MAEISKTAKKFTASIVFMIVIAACLAITTFAIAYSMLSVESNLFATGTIQINLNDGKPVISQDEHLMEPGATVKKEFFVENLSTWDVYYKLYFQNVSGGLSDVLIVKICDGETVLAEGTPNELIRANISTVEDALKVGERKSLQIYFYFPENAGNSAQDQTLSFDFAVDAVQTKNNPDKSFD